MASYNAFASRGMVASSSMHPASPLNGLQIMIHIELTPTSEGIIKKWGNLQMKFMICLLLCAKRAPMVESILKTWRLV